VLKLLLLSLKCRTPISHIAVPTLHLFEISADDPTCFLAFRSSGQNVIPVFCDEDVVFYPHAADRVVFLEEGSVDVYRVVRVFEVDLFEGVAGEIAGFGSWLAKYLISLLVLA
jgi:hypothetical protein